MIRRYGDRINEKLKDKYDQQIYDRYLESIFKSVNSTPNLGYTGRTKLGELHRNVSK